MADEDLDLDSGEEEEEAPKSSKKMMIIIIIGVVLLLIVGVLGGMFFGGVFDDEPASVETSQTADGDNPEPDDAEETVEEVADISYWPLEPAFVLNFEGKSKARFMQIGLEVSMTDEKSYAAVKKHLPVIRNEIVLLLSGQKYEEMVTPEGKEQLRAELIETVNNILKSHKAKKGIDNIYFTSFVMQ